VPPGGTGGNAMTARDKDGAARDKDGASRDDHSVVREEAHAAALYEADLDELLAFFSQPNLTIAQAEELLSRVHDERPRLVERLLAWLEEVGVSEAGASGSLAASAPLLLREASSTPAASPEAAPGTMHDVALVLLTYLGDRAIVPRLRALVRDPRASDEFKLKLISVIHDLEPQQDSQALLDHLRYPAKAMLQSHRKHLQRLASPLERSFWLELMAEDMSADARVSFARSSAEVNDPSAVPVLVCMCYDPDAQVALAAMDAVERYKDARALPALHELAQHHPDEQVREEAQKVADRLSVRVPLSPQVAPTAVDPLHASYLTTVDGLGEQAAVFVRHLPPLSLEVPSGDEQGEADYLRLVQVSFNDQSGIDQCFGLDMHRDDLEEVLGELGAQGLSPVQVPYDQALAQLIHACEWTWQAGLLLPLSFVAWREWIYETSWTRPVEISQEDEPPLGHDISDNLRGWLYVTCYGLLYQDEFVNWSLSTAAVDELGDDYVRLVQEHGEPLSAGMLRGLLCRGVEQIVHPQLRRQLQARLYRTAPLLRDLYQEEDVWRWAVVAADALREDSPYPWQEHPLLLGLVGCSLQLVLDRDLDWSIAL